MRTDLNKVLCERERHGSSWGYDETRNSKLFEQSYDRFEEVDDEPFHGVGSGHREGMKFRYGYNTKSLSEHLSPLYGIIRKNVGRKWDKIYSELCEVFDTRSVINNHILEHLYDRVAKPEDTFIHENGQVYVRGGYRWGSEPIAGSYHEYYVDPRDGILKRNRHRQTYQQVARLRAKREAEEEAKVRRVIDDKTELLNLEGLWYEVKFEDASGVTTYEPYPAVIGTRTQYRAVMVYPARKCALTNTYSSAKRVAVSKRTLSHKELKKHGLIN